MLYAAFGLSSVALMMFTFWLVPTIANAAIGKRYQWKQIVLDLLTTVALIINFAGHLWLWRYLLGDLAQ